MILCRLYQVNIRVAAQTGCIDQDPKKIGDDENYYTGARVIRRIGHHPYTIEMALWPPHFHACLEERGKNRRG